MGISVAVLQRTPLATQLLCRALNEQRGQFSVLAGGHTLEDFLRRVSEHKPEVAVISAILQDQPGAGVKIARGMRVASPETRVVVMLDCSDPPQVIEAFSAGARGVVCQTEPFETLCKCIRCVHEGQVWARSEELQWILRALAEREPVRVVGAGGAPLLTAREDEVVRLAVEGLPNPEIGQKLGMSAHTVKNHLYHIYEKLGISSRVELILYAMSRKQNNHHA